MRPSFFISMLVSEIVQLILTKERTGIWLPDYCDENGVVNEAEVLKVWKTNLNKR